MSQDKPHSILAVQIECRVVGLARALFAFTDNCMLSCSCEFQVSTLAASHLDGDEETSASTFLTCTITKQVRDHVTKKHRCYFCSFILSFFACISFDCSRCCGCLSLLLLFFIIRFSSPCARLKRKNGKQTSFILFVLSKVLVSLWISLVHKACLFDLFGMCFEGVRHYLLLIICYLLSWCLEKFVLSVQLFSCAWILWIGCLCCSCFLCLSWNCFSFSALSSCCFLYFISWLLVFLCGFLGCFFWSGNPPEGRLDMGITVSLLHQKDASSGSKMTTIVNSCPTKRDKK